MNHFLIFNIAPMNMFYLPLWFVEISIFCGAFLLRLIMEEFWKDIDGYEGYYEISNRGEVRKKNKKKPLIRVLNQNGYYQVTLSKKNIRKS